MSRVLPILFSADMVRAILDGKKTVTRRVCKDGNDYVVPDMSFYNVDKRTYAIHNYADKGHGDKLSIVERTCPICPGDILYVRETWQCLNPYSDKEYVYRASCDADYAKDIGKWLPSIHMPKEAARIWLKATDVQVEWLQDITNEQIICEGVNQRKINSYIKQMPEETQEWERAAYQLAWSELWNSTVKEEWQKYQNNPWVWVIEFEECEKPTT